MPIVKIRNMVKIKFFNSQVNQDIFHYSIILYLSNILYDFRKNKSFYANIKHNLKIKKIENLWHI